MSKNLKKYSTVILSVILCLMLLTTNICYAQYDKPIVEITDASSDKIKVSGSMPSGQEIFVTVYYPGYSNETLVYGDLTNVSKMLAYANKTIAENNEYSFDFKLFDNGGENGGGIFKVIVTSGNTKLPEAEFEFYFYGSKLDAIENINDNVSGDMMQLLKDAVRIYSMADSDLWKSGSEAQILTVLKNIKETKPYKKFDLDVNAFSSILADAMIVGNINNKKTNILIENGVLADTIISKAESNVQNDYKNSLSTEGISALNTAFFNQSYSLPDEIGTSLKKLIAFYGIKYYKDSGYGHIDSFINKYKTVYESEGFNLTGLESLSNKNLFYSTFAAYPASNMSELKNNFNSVLNTFLTPSTGNTGGTGGGGGGFSGGGKVSSSNSYIPEVVPAEPSAPSVTTFKDMSEAEWASTAVNTLKSENIISGYNDNTFKPMQHINRAEFAQLLLNLADATEYKMTEENTVAFDDVGDEWYKTAVLKIAGAGVINGKGNNTFAPLEEITREDAAVMIYRLLSKEFSFTEKAEFSDYGDISTYASDAISYLSAAKIISGKGDNLFMPKSVITRAETAQLIYNAYNMVTGGTKWKKSYWF